MSQSSALKRQSSAGILPERMSFHWERKATVRSFLFLKYRPRYQRRNTMNPMRRKIPSSEARIASSTTPAAPSFSIPLETDPITQSEAGIDLTLGAILASHVARDVVAGGEPVAQTTPESVSRKASDLVD